MKYPDREIFYEPYDDKPGCIFFSIRFKDIDTEFEVTSKELSVESHIEFALSLEPKCYTSQELYSKLTSFFRKEINNISILTMEPIDKSDFGKYLHRNDLSIKTIYRKENGHITFYGESFANGDSLIVYDRVRENWKYIIREKALIRGNGFYFGRDTIQKDTAADITIEAVHIEDFCQFNFPEIQKNIDENLKRFLSYLRT